MPGTPPEKARVERGTDGKWVIVGKPEDEQQAQLLRETLATLQGIDARQGTECAELDRQPTERADRLASKLAELEKLKRAQREFEKSWAEARKLHAEIEQRRAAAASKKADIQRRASEVKTSKQPSAALIPVLVAPVKEPVSKVGPVGVVVAVGIAAVGEMAAIYAAGEAAAAAYNALIAELAALKAELEAIAKLEIQLEQLTNAAKDTLPPVGPDVKVGPKTEPKTEPKPEPKKPDGKKDVDTVKPPEPAYRKGSKSATNLTPKKSDNEPGRVPGLSLTTTPQSKAAVFPGGKAQLEALGFIVTDDPLLDGTEPDPNHFTIVPGYLHILAGWTLDDWIKSKDTTNNEDPNTWHPLTKLLKAALPRYPRTRTTA